MGWAGLGVWVFGAVLVGWVSRALGLGAAVVAAAERVGWEDGGWRGSGLGHVGSVSIAV